MTKPFSDRQKLRILVAHGAVALQRGELVPLHHVLWASAKPSKRMEQLRGMFVAVRCACGGKLAAGCDGTTWLRLADVEYDHHQAHVFGGETHQRNGRPLASACHAIKSARETIAVKKTDRIRKKLAGQKKPKRAWPTRPLRSGSGWPPRKTKRSELHAQA